MFISFIGFLLIFFYRPIAELDFFWRALIGRSYLIERGVPDYGLRTWSSESIYEHWSTTQPLGEVLLFLIYEIGGLELLALVRLLIWIFIVWAIYVNVLRTDFIMPLTVIQRSCLITLTSLGICLLVPFIQERPQTFILLILAFLGPYLARGVIDSRRKLSYPAISLVIMSIGLHPSWVILYIMMVLPNLKTIFLRFKEESASIIHTSKVIPYPKIFLLISIPTLPFFGPSGLNYYSNLLEIARAGNESISEWQPLLEFGNLNWLSFAYPIFCFLFLIFLFLIYQIKQGYWLLYVGLTLTLLTPYLSIRFMPFAILIVMSYLSGLLLTSNTNKYNVGHNKNFSSVVSSKQDRRVVVIMLIPIVFAMISFCHSATKALDAYKHFLEIAPIRIIKSMGELGAVRVINGPNEGGYIHFFGGDNVSPMFDGRADRNRPSSLDELARILNSARDANQLLTTNRYSAATDILTPQDSDLIPAAYTGFRFICAENGYRWYSRNAEAECI